MATIILRPTTATGAGWSAVPSGTLIDVLSDDSYQTWARSSPLSSGYERVLLGFGTQDIPSSARVARIRVFNRTSLEPVAGHPYAQGQYDVRILGRFYGDGLYSAEDVVEVGHQWSADVDATALGNISSPGFVEMRFWWAGAPPMARAQLHGVWLEAEWFHQPETTVLLPPDPVTDTTRPTVGWGYSQVDGLPQSAWYVQILDLGPEPWPAGRVVWRSDWQYGTDSQVQVPVDLENGRPYEVTVGVRAQWGGQGHLQSEFATSTFTLDLDTPAAPDVQVTPHPDDGRTLVEIAAVPGDVDAGWFTVQHRDDDDGPWVTLRGGGDLDATSGPVAIFDHEAPFNLPRTYRVRAHAEVGAEQVAGPPVDVDATLEVVGRWLTDPRDPAALNMEVSTREHSRTIQGREQVHMPAGMAVAVVESEPAVLHQTLSVWALDPQEHQTLYAALRSTRTLLYRDWRSTVYFRWTGDRTAQQWAKDFHNIDAMTGTMVEVARPAP